jgi:uncharacterized membrane protein YebE (DUF533 family)
MKKNMLCALMVLGLTCQTASASFMDFVKTYLLFGDKKKSALVWGGLIATGATSYAGYKIYKSPNNIFSSKNL